MFFLFSERPYPVSNSRRNSKKSIIVEKRGGSQKVTTTTTPPTTTTKGNSSKAELLQEGIFFSHSFICHRRFSNEKVGNRKN